MTALTLRKLRIHVKTADGPYGCTLSFTGAFTILQARNSVGKSTCMNAILYALGLDGMLGPSHLPPLSAAVLDELQGPNGEHKVESSWVQLEIANEHSEVVTVERGAATESPQQRQIVRVLNGPAVTDPGEYAEQFLHVRVRGSAKHDAGFHTFLARFCGLQLPHVPTGDGTLVPLYLECLFPFFFVDQWSGWRELRARMPTYLGIADVGRRAVEYIMNMDILSSEVERRSIAARRSQIESEWRSFRDEIRQELAGTGVVVRGVASSPAKWNLDEVALWATDGEEWYPFQSLKESLQTSLKNLRERAVPNAAEYREDVLEQVRVAEDALSQHERQYTELVASVRDVEQEVRDIDERLSALHDNLREYEDERLIRKRGFVNDLSISAGECPTCGQTVRDDLLDPAVPINPMSIEENIAFLRDQVRMFDLMRQESVAVLRARESQIPSARNKLSESSAQLQSLRQTLRQDGDAPALAMVRRQVEVEGRLRGLDDGLAIYERSITRGGELAKAYADASDALKAVGNRKLSDNDKERLAKLENAFCSQLSDYGFSSFPVPEVAIGEESYQPEHNGLPLGLISASDMIRVIWAYLIGLMECRNMYSTNHIGIVVMDEPKQHNPDESSYEGFLVRAAQVASEGGQVVMATNQDRKLLEKCLEGLDANIVSLEGRVLTKLDEE